MEPIYRDWGDPRDKHLTGEWYGPLPQRAFRCIRPPAAEYANWLWANVFAGVKHPFDPRKATGWMQKLFGSRERQDKVASRGAKPLREILIGQFGWREDDGVFLLHAAEHGYRTTVATFLEYRERFLSYFETGILCHPNSRDVTIFWEGEGPYFTQRRQRVLETTSGPASS